MPYDKKPDIDIYVDDDDPILKNRRMRELEQISSVEEELMIGLYKEDEKPKDDGILVDKKEAMNCFLMGMDVFADGKKVKTPDDITFSGGDFSLASHEEIRFKASNNIDKVNENWKKRAVIKEVDEETNTVVEKENNSLISILSNQLTDTDKKGWYIYKPESEVLEDILKRVGILEVSCELTKETEESCTLEVGSNSGVADISMNIYIDGELEATVTELSESEKHSVAKAIDEHQAQSRTLKKNDIER